MKIAYKVKKIIVTYIQILVVMLAFVSMTILSYVYMYNIEYNNLKREANTILTYMQTDIMISLSMPEIALEKVKNKVNSMIEEGEDFDAIKDLVINISKYFYFSQDIINTYAFFDVPPTDSIWYKAVLDANSKIAIVEHFDESLNTHIITYVCRIFDKAGNSQGFIGFNINIDNIIKKAINMQINNNGFGLILNGNLELLAHPEPEYIGKLLKNTNLGIIKFMEDFEHGKEIFEYEVVNYRNEESVAFFRQMANGWYSGIVTSKKEYYKNIRELTRYIITLGVIFSLVLSIILIRIINAKESVNKLIRNKKQELEVMAHWYKSVLNAIPLPITVTDINAKWTFINTAVEKFLGITLEEAIGKPCSNWNISICNTPECCIEYAKRDLKQTFFSHNDLSYQVNVEILKNIEGEPIGYIEIVQDITKVEQMARVEADSANKAKSLFLAKMSHEIRTPMNAIMGVVEIQIQDETLPPKIKESFAMIYNSSSLLLGIINDILDLSKIEAGKMELVLAKYEIASLINDTVQLNIMQNSKRIVFELFIDENIPMELIGDEIRIKQILNNLLSNAFKYTEEGKIKLSIFAENENKDNIILVFIINDTGYGMTEEQIRKLFSTEYIRFNLESNRSISGTGLGLNITQHLVHIMGGKISADSKLGKGSTFTVRLPQSTAGSNILGKKLAESLMQLRSIDKVVKKAQIIREYMPYGSVMIVDDVDSNLFVAKGLMIPYGLSVDTVSSGLSAINKIKSGKVYDIIFMDYMMPEMDGMEAVKIIRELGYKHPIVALTANALIGQAKIFLENGFDDFLPKPIDVRQLNAILNKLIRNKQPPEVIAEARRKELLKSTQRLPIIVSEIDAVSHTIFARDAKKALLVFDSVLKNLANASDEDLHLFIVKAHAMKSALANIGEDAYSQIAFTLERAGKERDRNTIMRETQKLIDTLKSIIEKNETETQKKVTDKDENVAYLSEQLKIIADACINYDAKTAEIAVMNLMDMSWTKETKDIIDKISEHILHSDFEEACVLIQKNSIFNV
jgi:PAS domain S-box-containing protein